MKNFINKSLLFFLIAISTVSISQKIENSIFWEVSGNGLSSPSYVFGTVKFIPAKDFVLGKNVKAKLKESSIFATETLLDHHSLHELNKAAHLPHHQSIKDLLSKKEYSDLKKIFTEQLDVSNLKFELVYSQFKPVVLSTTMTRLSLKKDVKYFEIELVNIANKNGLLTLGLETASREIEAIESFDKESQIKALKQSIENFDKQLMDYKEFIEAYKLGDLHKTLEFTLHPSENNENFRKNFFDQRNSEWIPNMEKYMKQSSTFFALGAAHLADDKGIIRQLRDSGYTVTPMPLK
jgi:uncharacterized protein YbaP (TraB family)